MRVTPRLISSASSIETLEKRIAPAGFIFAANRGIVGVLADPENDGVYATSNDSFTPFANYQGPLFVAAGDFNGDGNDELVTAMGKGAGAAVKIWAITGGGTIGQLIDSFAPFTGAIKGASVAAGDLNGDGKDELIVGSGPGGQSVINIYRDTDADGMVSDNSFDAFDPEFKRGGVKLATGNTDNAVGDELVVGAWSRGGTVKIFKDVNANALISDDLPAGELEDFTPFGAKYLKGVNIAAGPLENAGSNGAEVIVSKAKGKPAVVIFTDSNANGQVSDNDPFDTLPPSGPGFASGANVAAGDTDNSGSLVEVIVAPATGRGSIVKIFDDNADAGSLLSDNPFDSEGDAFAAKTRGGVNVAIGKVTRESFTLTAPRVLPDNGTATATIVVPVGAGIVRDLNVQLSIFHTFNADLDVVLTHVASGTSVVLFTDVGNNDDGFIIQFDDAAATDIGSAADDQNDHVVAGSFNLEGIAILAAFNGLDASGEWRLTITDDSASDTGTLFAWSLLVTL